MNNKLGKNVNLDKKKLIIILSSIFFVVMLIVLISTKGLLILKDDSIEKYDPSISCVGCTTDAVILGDFNLDGKVDWNDYYALAAYNTTLYKEGKYSTNSEDQLRAADWNKDGFVYFDDQSNLRNYLENQKQYDEDGYPQKTCGKDYSGPYKKEEGPDPASYYCKKNITEPYIYNRKNNKYSYILESTIHADDDKTLGFNENYKLVINNELMSSFESHAYSVVREANLYQSNKFRFLCYEDQSKKLVGYLDEELCKKNGYVTFQEGDNLSRLTRLSRVRIIHNYIKNKYKIIYKNIESTNNDLSEYKVVGKSITVPSIKYSLNGKTFKGWYLQSNKGFYCYLSKDHTAKNWVSSCDESDMVLFKPSDKVNFAVSNNSLSYIVSPGDVLFMNPKFVDNKSTGEENNSTQKLINYFTIKYDGGSGTSGRMDDQQIEYGSASPLSLNKFKKSDYIFSGWHAEKDDGTWWCYSDSSHKNISWVKKDICEKYDYVNYRDGQKISKISNPGMIITMHAQWEINSFKVKFMAPIATGSMSDQTITYGKPTKLNANKFKKSGYVFYGWYAQRDDNSWLCYTDSGKQNTEWLPLSKCNFGRVLYADQQKVAKTANPGRYVSMVAQWKSNTFTVKFYSNSGNGSMPDQTIKYGQSTKLSTNKFWKNGYDFIGWHAQRDDNTWLCYTDPGHQRTEWMKLSKCNFGYVTYDNQELVARTANPGRVVKMYAQWKANSFTVNYYSGGGTGTMSTQKITYGVSTRLFANKFTRSEYSFIGWHAQRDDGTWLCYTDPGKQDMAWMSISKCNFGYVMYNNQEYVAKTANTGRSVNLVAQWKPNFFTVRYNGNGGAGSMSDQKITYGVPTKLKSNSFKKSGYKFKEWYAKWGNEWLCYTDPGHQKSTWMVESKCNFGKDPYSNAAKVAKTVPAGQVVTMYAVWKKNTCSTEYYCTRGSKVGDGPSAYCHEQLYKAKKTVYECEKGYLNTKDGYCVRDATYLYTDQWNRKVYANCNSLNGEWLDGSKCKKAAKSKYGSNKASCPNGGIRDGAYCYNEYNISKRQVCN